MPDKKHSMKSIYGLSRRWVEKLEAKKVEGLSSYNEKWQEILIFKTIWWKLM